MKKHQIRRLQKKQKIQRKRLKQKTLISKIFARNLWTKSRLRNCETASSNKRIIWQTSSSKTQTRPRKARIRPPSRKRKLFLHQVTKAGILHKSQSPEVTRQTTRAEILQKDRYQKVSLLIRLPGFRKANRIKNPLLRLATRAGIRHKNRAEKMTLHRESKAGILRRSPTRRNRHPEARAEIQTRQFPLKNFPPKVVQRKTKNLWSTPPEARRQQRTKTRTRPTTWVSILKLQWPKRASETSRTGPKTPTRICRRSSRRPSLCLSPSL